MTSENRRPPAGLGAAGKRFYRQVCSGYTLRTDEFVLLEVGDFLRAK